MDKTVENEKSELFGMNNFRVFNNKQRFYFNPISIITGTNSSGKSSIIKGLLLLKDNIESFFPPYCLKFNNDNFHKLSSPKNIVNNPKNEISFFFKTAGKNKWDLEIKYVMLNKQFKDIYLSEIIVYKENSKTIILKTKLNHNLTNNGMYEGDVDVSYYIDFKRLLKESQVYKTYDYNDTIVDIELISNLFNVDPKDFDFKERVIEHEFDIITNILSTSFNMDYNLNHSVLQELHDCLYGDNGWESDIIEDNQIFGELKNRLINSGYIADEEFLKLINNKSLFDFNSHNLICLIDCLKYAIKEINTIHISIKNIYYVPSNRSNQERLSMSHNQNKWFFSLIDSFYTYLASLKNEKHYKDKEEFKFYKRQLERFNIPIEINQIEDIAFQINHISKSKKKYNLADIGFGYYQLLPIIISIILYKKNTILLEEPENNLHPALQSKLAELFVDAYNTFGTRFIIESHSEYLVRRLQYLTANKSIDTSDTVLYYLFHPESSHFKETGEQVRKIEILPDGRLSKEFGTGFFDESTNLMLSILTGESLN